MADHDNLRIGFLGAGKMATALAKGWLKARLVSSDRLCASDPVAEARASFQKETRSQVLDDNRKVASRSDLLVLAVKPQNMAGLLGEIRPAVTPAHLVVSIAAGITLHQLAEGLGPDRRLIRVMPNTPCLVGASASAFAPGAGAGEQDVRLVDQLLNAVGRAFLLPEKLLDAVTGLSGSGPAFVFVLIEALSDGGVRMGLPRDIATLLAAQTVFGSAKLMLETGQAAGVLKDQVASPGGTTIAGLHALERAGFRAALIDAVEAATLRSIELGNGK
jgi:pyrroline-5-carboxylate reductase